MKYLNMNDEEDGLMMTSRIKKELLLSEDEYLSMRDEIKDILGVDECPKAIPGRLFFNLLDLHL